jgi:hypothetical protein
LLQFASCTGCTTQLFDWAKLDEIGMDYLTTAGIVLVLFMLINDSDFGVVVVDSISFNVFCFNALLLSLVKPRHKCYAN